MSSNAKSENVEQRRKPRVTIPEHPEIRDVHSGETVGQLVNLSGDGLMIVSPQCISCGTVRQMRIPLIVGNSKVEIVVGAESLWCEDANDSGAHWTGFSIIDISPEHREILNAVVGD